LVVEDEVSIASFISLYLKNAGYRVKAVGSGGDALAQVELEQPALIVLDLMLPDMDGIDVCRRIRQGKDIPILMLTARDEDVDKIIGLEVGADDYLTKPFNPRELVARVKSILRRSTPARRASESAQIRHGDLHVDSGRREAHVGEEANVFRSLRFRLPALFLAAIVLAGLVSTAVAVSVSKRYAQTTLRKQAFRELGTEARGINQIYKKHAGGQPPDSHELERASGDEIYYVQRAKGIDVFPGPTTAFTLLPRSILDFRRILAGESVQFVFTPPARKTRLLGFAMPVTLGDKVFGALILARPTTRLNQSWLPFVWRLLPAFFAGI